MNDTIAAISTALGVGAISIVRLSGPDAIKIANKIFDKDLTNQKTHTITYGYIKDSDKVIDEVLLTVMRAPKTFTTEDIVEINCHGGIATTRKVLELLIKNGCRIAEKGEFTKRAFLNGRIDLVEAEAIKELVNTKNDQARQIAIENLKGETSNKIKKLRNELRKIISNIEVNIDYPEYLDIEVMTTNKIKESIVDIEYELDKIIENSKNSRILKEGIRTVIIGRPNVGKSSILNKFSGYNKAIVTDIPGTTRDIVEEEINLDGITLNLIDTAGIREADNLVEQIGVEKSIEQIDKADLIILVLNNNEELTKEDLNLLESVKDKTSIIVINKNDLKNNLDITKINNKNIVYTDTKSDNGIDTLKIKIKELFNIGKINYNEFVYVSSLEQLNKLQEAKESIENIKIGLEKEEPIDIIEIDIKNIWNILGEITGESYTEELLDNLFSDFCVGK